MNKLFTKIVGACLGLTMAVGVGVAVASNSKSAETVEAATSTKTGSWDLTSADSDFTSSGCVTYFSQPYGMKQANAYIQTKVVSDFSTTGTTQIKVGIKCLQNGGTGSRLTVTLVNSSGTTIGSGIVLTPDNYNAANKTTYKYATFTSNLSGAYGFKCQCTTFNKNILINGADYEVTYTESSKTLSSIAVTTPPTKTSYYVNESFDSSGMVVTATYSDASTANVTSSCTFSPSTFVSTGNQNVTASYTEGGTTKTATQAVSVSADSLSSISIADYKTTLAKGASFDFGGTVTAHYASGSTADVTASATFTGYNMSSAGDQTVTVHYTEGTEKTATYTLSVVNLNIVEFVPGTDTGDTSVTKSGVTATMTTMNNNSYYQIYAGQSGTFTCEANILKIEFTCTASGTAKYGPGNTSANVGSYSYDDITGTWTGSAKSVTLSSTAQVRMLTLVITTEALAVPATINGASNVNVGIEWTPTSITEDDGGATVTGATYSFAASNGAVISSSTPATGAFTCSAAGTVTVSATKDGWAIADKVVTVNSAAPYINLTLESASTAYTGQTVSISSAFGNGVTGLTWSITSGAIIGTATSSDSGYSAKIGGETGTLTIKAEDSGTSGVSSTVSVDVTKTAFTTSPAASASVMEGKTTTLNAALNSGGSISWSSDDTSVATVSGGVVTGVAVGSATITAQSADDPRITAECEVTVTEKQLYYSIIGPAQSQGGSTGATVSGLNEFFPIDSDYYIEWTGANGSAYASSGYAMKFGTSTASATGSVTLSLKSGAPIYFTKIVINAKGWSDGTETLVVNGGTPQAISSSGWDDYEFSIANDATSITIGNGQKRVSIYAIDVYYAEKAPALHVSSSSVEAAINTSNAHVNFTYDNYTPTSYTAVVKSGSSLTASAVSFNTSSTPHTATFTTGSSTGATVFTITGTGGGKSASVDVTVTVTNPRNIIDLEITTAGTATFKVGETFDVGSLVVTATYDAAPTTVVYSKANDNLGELTFSPEIGYEFTESDIGSQTITISQEFGTGDESASYTATVSDKDYATLVTSVADLWDGQKVYFSNNSDMTVNKYISGNNVGSSSATFHPTKGLDIASTNGYGYTVGRTKVNGVIYYTFALEDGGVTYYLKDNGTSGNYLSRTSDVSDDAIYWTISAGSNSGQWVIANKSVTARPNLQINGSLMSCYNNTQTNPYLYKVTAYDEQAVADAFVDRYLHMDEDVPGQCNDYYPILKPVWAAMGDFEKAAVSGAAYERLQAWAAAHGEHLDSNMDLVSNSKNPLLGTVFANDSAVAIIVVISMVGLTAIGGYFFIRRRKEN